MIIIIIVYIACDQLNREKNYLLFRLTRQFSNYGIEEGSYSLNRKTKGLLTASEDHCFTITNN